MSKRMNDLRYRPNKALREGFQPDKANKVNLKQKGTNDYNPDKTVTTSTPDRGPSVKRPKK